MLARTLALIAWTMATTLVFLAFIAWGQSYKWQLNALNIYAIFPFLGLTAFSLMLSHYVIGSLKRHFNLDSLGLQQYFQWTSYLVLICLLLHPGLFVWQLWQDGYGLPPASYQEYISSSLLIFLLFGNISLMAFLAYESKRWFENRSWWPWVLRAGDAGMILIFSHALKLGSQLQVVDWYRFVWYVYGVVLIGCIVYGLQKSAIKQD